MPIFPQPARGDERLESGSTSWVKSSAWWRGPWCDGAVVRATASSTWMALQHRHGARGSFGGGFRAHILNKQVQRRGQEQADNRSGTGWEVKHAMRITSIQKITFIKDIDRVRRCSHLAVRRFPSSPPRHLQPFSTRSGVRAPWLNPSILRPKSVTIRGLLTLLPLWFSPPRSCWARRSPPKNPRTTMSRPVTLHHPDPQG